MAFEMKLRSRLAVLVILFGLTRFAPIGALYGTDLQASEPTGQTPIWRLDLHAFGFANDQEKRGEYSLSRIKRAVALTSSGNVAVIFETFKMGSRGFVPGTSSMHFLIVDRDSGKVTISKEWPPDGTGESSIVTTPDDHLLLYSDFGRTVALYSSQLELISSSNFKKQDEIGSNWVSTDGRYVFYEIENSGRYRLTAINTDTLKTVDSWTSDLGIAAVSDRYLARWEQVKNQYRRSLLLRSRDSEWKEIYRDTGCNEAFAFVQFLTQDRLLIRSCDKATVLNDDGNVSFVVTVPPKHDIGLAFGSSSDFGASSDGKRFAISIAQLKKQPWWTGDPGYDRVHPTLNVYDAGSVPISSFTLNKNEEKPFAFAFSADGSTLALLRSGFLELYRLPAKP